MSLHFPLPKSRTFRFSLHASRLSLLKWSPLWRWISLWVHTFRCQENSHSLFWLCQMAWATGPVTKAPRQMIKFFPVLDISSHRKNEACYIVREVRSVRERERQTDRQTNGRKWRHHCRLKLFVCLFVSYLFRVGHSTDMCSLLKENLLGEERECIEVTCTCMLKEDMMKMKHFKMEITQDHPELI